MNTDDNRHPWFEDDDEHTANNILSIAEELIDFVIAKYNIKTLNDFTCPIHKRLAIALGKFREGE